MRNRIALVDTHADLMSTAWTLSRDGNEVLYYTHEKKDRKIGEGLVTRAQDLREVVAMKPDVVVAYNCPELLPALKKLPVVCCSKESVELEENRQYGVDVAMSAGIAVPETHEFSNVEKARKFIEENRSRKKWVFKACGERTDVSTTHVTRDDAHLMMVLEFEETAKRAKTFILQEFIDGIEISTEGWFHYDSGWASPINSTLERKHESSGDHGKMAGCMGSVVWPWAHERPKLFRQTLEKLTPFLERIKFIGCIDINCIIDYKDHTPYFLEFTPRIGSNAFEALTAGMGFGIGNMFVELSRGELKSMNIWSNFMTAVSLYTPALPDFPIMAPIDDERRFCVKDIWRDENDVLRVVGSESLSGMAYILDATAAGVTVERTMAEVYEDVIPLVVAPDLDFRDDIGEKASRDIDLLESWGYVVHAEEKHRRGARAVISLGGV